MTKTDLLFIVKGFYPAGAERYMYEIDNALDKEKYKVTILCLEKKSKINSKWDCAHYDTMHQKLGSKILFLDDFLITKTIFKRVKSKLNKFFFKKKYEKNIDLNSFNRFLSRFAIINWIGEYTYFDGICKENLRKSLIHIMSAKFQNSDIYKKFDFNFNYNFISAFNGNEYLDELNEFKNINHYFFPLLLKIPFQENPWKFNDSKIKKIGIFTRLDKYKPLDPFFYSFQLLLDKLPDCELHVFGSGNPEKEGMTRYLKSLGITKSVFFRGHQANIVKTVLHENINLSWFQGYNNNRPAGYAGFDICTSGTPLVCWDFVEIPNNPFYDVYPHYKNLTQFVAKSFELLTNVESAKKLSKLQFDSIANERDITKHIILLEEIFSKVLVANK